jgi:hypothetical protein
MSSSSSSSSKPSVKSSLTSGDVFKRLRDTEETLKKASQEKDTLETIKDFLSNPKVGMETLISSMDSEFLESERSKRQKRAETSAAANAKKREAAAKDRLHLSNFRSMLKQKDFSK